MKPDPRIEVLRAVLSWCSDAATTRRIKQIIARMDAVDPLRFEATVKE